MIDSIETTLCFFTNFFMLRIMCNFFPTLITLHKEMQGTYKKGERQKTRQLDKRIFIIFQHIFLKCFVIF